MASWPTLPQVRAFLRLQPDPAEDQVIGYALAAAVDYGVRRLGGQSYVNPDGSTTWVWSYPQNTTTLPDSIYQASLIHAARLYRRRDSIDGTLGFGDLGLVRVGRADPDIEAMYSLVGPLVFG